MRLRLPRPNTGRKSRSRKWSRQAEAAWINKGNDSQIITFLLFQLLQTNRAPYQRTAPSCVTSQGLQTLQLFDHVPSARRRQLHHTESNRESSLAQPPNYRATRRYCAGSLLPLDLKWMRQAARLLLNQIELGSIDARFRRALG